MKRERLQRKINKIIPTTQCIAYVKQWPNKAKDCDIDFNFVKTNTTVTESMPIKASEIEMIETVTRAGNRLLEVVGGKE
jgi:hypothetical protein